MSGAQDAYQIFSHFEVGNCGVSVLPLRVRANASCEGTAGADPSACLARLRALRELQGHAQPLGPGLEPVCRCVKWYGAGLMLGACPLKPAKDGKGPGELCRGRLAWISCLHSVCVDARSCASHALQAMLCAGDCRSSFLLVDGCLDLLATVALEVQHMWNASFLLSAVSCCHRRKPKRRLRADSYLGWCSGSEARPRGIVELQESLYLYCILYTYTRTETAVERAPSREPQLRRASWNPCSGSVEKVRITRGDTCKLPQEIIIATIQQ